MTWPWYAYVLIGVMVMSALGTVWSVGKPRRPLTPDTAVFVIVTNALMIWAIVALAERAS